jgi:glycosyltransferase involved in cell wall biosynthesis
MKVSFVIPFHNEEKNARPMLERVIKFTQAEDWNFEIIPVDDRSSDKTGKILNDFAKKYKFIHPIHREKHDGEVGNTMGKTLKEGTRKAKGRYIIWTMGDLSDNPKTYKEIVKKLDDGYDLVFGSRYMKDGSSGDLGFIKALLTKLGVLVLARGLFGIKVHDITNAFRGFRKDIFERLNIEANGFDISPEFALKAHKAGLKLGEVPTNYKARVDGISNFKISKMALSYLWVFLKIFTNLTKTKK